MVKEGRAPGVGALNPVLSHFHWVGICLVRLAGLTIKDGHQNMDTKGLSPVGLYFFQKYHVIESTCSKLHRELSNYLEIKKNAPQ